MWSVVLIVLASATPQSCWEAFKADVQTVFDFATQTRTDSTLLLRLYYSGRDINDLGHFDACQRLQGARYVTARATLPGEIAVSLGLCLPMACDAESLTMLMTRLSIPVSFTDPTPPPFTSGGHFMMWLIVGLLTLVLAGSILDLIWPEERPGLCQKLVRCFSLPRNWAELKQQHIVGTTRIFNGARVMSIGWVVLGHIHIMRAAGPISNLEDLPGSFAWDSMMYVYGGYYAVDFFFWVGGFVLGYLTLGELCKRRGRIPWGLVIVLRLMRLMPVYAFCLGFSYWVMPYLVVSPMWDLSNFLVKDCEDYWWTNFLFINNFVPDGLGNACFGHAWYMANDFQLFIAALLVIALYYFLPVTISWTIGGLLTVAGVVVRLIIAMEYDFTVSTFTETSIENHKSRRFYNKPYVRCLPYLFGLFVGFVYFEFRNGAKSDFIAQKVIRFFDHRFGSVWFFIGWAVYECMLRMMKVCFQDVEHQYMGYSLNMNIFLLSIETFVISIAFTLLFVPLLLGKLQIVTALLGHKWFDPLSKLTYSIYLSHPPVMAIFWFLETGSYNISTLNLFTDFVFYLPLTFLGGLVIYLLLEAPIGQIANTIIKGKKKKVASGETLVSKEIE